MFAAGGGGADEMRQVGGCLPLRHTASAMPSKRLHFSGSKGWSLCNKGLSDWTPIDGEQQDTLR